MTGLAGASPSALAGWCRQEVGVTHRPPVNAPLVAARLGVDIDLSHGLDADAVYEDSGTSPRILLRADSSTQSSTSGLTRRQLFSVAHELGHHVLAVRRNLTHDQQLRHEGIEAWCDAFASCLLIPPGWLRDSLSDKGPSLQGVLDVARTTGTSTSAAVVSLAHNAGWNVALLAWSKRGERWRLSAITAPLEVREVLSSAPATSAVIDQIANTSRPVEVALPLRVSGHVRPLRAQVAKQRNFVAFLELDQVWGAQE